MSFRGIRWVIILVIAFCGFDLAGIGLHLPPEPAGIKSRQEGYLFAVWMAGASLSTMMTW